MPTNKFSLRELRMGQRVAHEDSRMRLGTVIELGQGGIKEQLWQRLADW